MSYSHCFSLAGALGRRRRVRRVAPLAIVLTLGVAGIVSAQSPNTPPVKPGFPLTLAGQGTLVDSKPLIADLGLSADGTKSIVFGTNRGDLHVLYKNASNVWGEAPGFPVAVGGTIASSPAAGDLDGDGAPDIVVGWGNSASRGPGGVKAYKRNGMLLWARASQDRLEGGPDGQPDPVFATPAIGDVDGDGHNEVVWGGFDYQLYVVNGATGADKAGWPKFMRDTIWSSPALHDIDGDGKLDIVVGVDAHAEGPPYNTPAGGCLHVLRFDSTQSCSNPSDPVTCGPPTEVPGFPRCVDQVITSSPAIGDIDGDGKPEIIHGTGTFYPNRAEAVYAWHCDGSAVAGWPVAVQGQVGTSPALADLNGDGKVDVVVTADNTRSSSTFHVYAIKGDGTILWSAVPKDFFGATFNAGDPVIGDVLGDGGLEVLVPSNTSAVAFSATGTQLTDPGTHPGGSTYAFYTASTLSGVAVGDLETDNAKIEVVAISGTTSSSSADTKVNVWNPVNRSSNPPWGQFHQNAKRTGDAPGTGSCTYHGACMVSSAAQQFYTIPAPCRLVDTRNPNGPLGGPALSSGVLRDFTLTGTCGLPATAKALSLNITVVSPTGSGFLSFSPGCQPPLASTLNFVAGQTRANNAILPVDANGVLTVSPAVSGAGTVQLILDVNGYFQ